MAVGGPGASDPAFRHPGPGADHPAAPVITHPEASGPAGFYVRMKRGRRVAYLLGPPDTYEQAAGQVPLGRRLAEQVDPRSASEYCKRNSLGAVRAEQAQRLAMLDAEVDVIDRGVRAEPVAEIDAVNGVGHGFPISSASRVSAGTPR
jgi:hypothetical protein